MSAPTHPDIAMIASIYIKRPVQIHVSQIWADMIHLLLASLWLLLSKDVIMFHIHKRDAAYDFRIFLMVIMVIM